MHEGRIIKYFRKKAKLTQQQLGDGICSDTHVSKIERGMTEYSPEVTFLLSKRLGINIEEELSRFHNLKKILARWHDAIIMQRSEVIETIKEELDKEELIKISEYQILYDLLRARYHLLRNNLIEADIIIKNIQKAQRKLPPYESNLLKHILGMYYLANKDMIKAVNILRSINSDDYNNPEYYLTLSTAYLAVNSKIMAYYYAELSLQFFLKTNNYLRGIDAEMIMLITREGEGQRDFQKIVEQYEALIQICDLCHAHDKKAKVLHNLAEEHYCRKDYKASSRLFHKSMLLKEKKSAEYLISLEAFILCCFEGSILSKDKLEKLGNEGLVIAREINQGLHSINLQLLLLRINNQHTEYYHFLSTKALPYYKKCGYVTIVKQYEKELFNYHLKTRQIDDALKLADLLINNG
ncbi:helix-turn-helix domain-containing protein [Sutcliffiella horikoshii]|uniref:helix-turn-helix domain-containing protein n=1 Tax=Sutcliffiella horikoshii TaxID=79883 RepID=UPI001CC19ED4|nr:helix-turn-helix transcriptional regulator [Sutcliffiella horikoshii]UAL46424.1 helix-turn-helix domain-containing protein [Sutcliffiella horikoshii]